MKETPERNPLRVVEDKREQALILARWLGYEHAQGRQRDWRVDVTASEFSAYVEGYQAGERDAGLLD
ncbi:hypothetical protein [Nocardia sp. IFM 10818]